MGERCRSQEIWICNSWLWILYMWKRKACKCIETKFNFLIKSFFLLLFLNGTSAGQDVGTQHIPWELLSARVSKRQQDSNSCTVVYSNRTESTKDTSKYISAICFSRKSAFPLLSCLLTIFLCFLCQSCG